MLTLILSVPGTQPSVLTDFGICLKLIPNVEKIAASVRGLLLGKGSARRL
jgi:hypothetical protein